MKSFWIYFFLISFSGIVLASEKTHPDNTSTIKDFSYRGVSFNTTKEELLKNNYICEDDICEKLNLFVDFDYGFLNPSGTVHNGVTVVFYDNIVRQIKIEQLYPHTTEECTSIVKDLKSAFEIKYKTGLEYARSYSRFGDGFDYSKFNGTFVLGKDKVNVYGGCNIVTSSKDDSSYFYFKSIFTYENMASRFIVDGL